MRHDESALAEIIEQQTWEHDGAPREHDRAATKMAEIDIERFRSGDGEEHSANGHEGDVRLTEQIGHRVVGVHRIEDGGVISDVRQAGNADRHEPSRSDWTEDDRHAAGAKTLNGEEDR